MIRRWTILALLWIAVYSCAAQTCTPGGGVTCTPNLNLWLPPASYTNWNVPLNANFNSMDQYLGGTLSLPHGLTATGTITASQYCIGISCITSWGSGGGGLTEPLNLTQPMTGTFATFSGDVTSNGNLIANGTAAFNSGGTFNGPMSGQALSLIGLMTAKTVTATSGGVWDAAVSGAVVIGTDVSGQLLARTTTGSGQTVVVSNSPTLVGTPSAPTAAPGTNTAQIATTAFVTAAVGGGLVPDVTITVPSFAVPSNQCYGSAGSTTPAVFSMPSLVVGMKVSAGDTGNPSAITGWGASGGLTIRSWASALGTGSYIVCNTTAASITGGAINFVMGAQ